MWSDPFSLVLWFAAIASCILIVYFLYIVIVGIPLLRKARGVGRIHFLIGLRNSSMKGPPIHDTQEVDIVLNITNANNKAAKVDGPPRWESSDETIATVTPSEDGLRAVVKGVEGGTGPVRITVSADADLGEGVQTLSDFIEFEFSTALAANLGLTIGVPHEQGTTPAPDQP